VQYVPLAPLAAISSAPLYGQPVCLLGGVLFYFETEREAQAFLGQCEEENRLVDLATFAI
jgi:hypothetical protein